MSPRRRHLLLLLAPPVLIALGAALYLPWARTRPVHIPYDRLPPPVYIPTREANEVLPPEVKALRAEVETLQEEFWQELSARVFLPPAPPPPPAPDLPAPPPAAP